MSITAQSISVCAATCAPARALVGSRYGMAAEEEEEEEEGGEKEDEDEAAELPDGRETAEAATDDASDEG